MNTEETALLLRTYSIYQGSQGVATDAAVHYVNWGCSLSAITCRLHVFYGTEDLLVQVDIRTLYHIAGTPR